MQQAILVHDGHGVSETPLLGQVPSIPHHDDSPGPVKPRAN